MLRSLKWAFKLGQKFERQRIANILAEQRRTIRYRDGLTKDEKERHTRMNAVQSIINNIVDEITQENKEQVAGHSILFPKD